MYKLAKDMLKGHNIFRETEMHILNPGKPPEVTPQRFVANVPDLNDAEKIVRLLNRNEYPDSPEG